eukprot:scaffold257370_cov44-Prasinocladus_malaysianus.AAC.1
MGKGENIDLLWSPQSQAGVQRLSGDGREGLNRLQGPHLDPQEWPEGPQRRHRSFSRVGPQRLHYVFYFTSDQRLAWPCSAFPSALTHPTQFLITFI